MPRKFNGKSSRNASDGINFATLFNDHKSFPPSVPLRERGTFVPASLHLLSAAAGTLLHAAYLFRADGKCILMISFVDGLHRGDDGGLLLKISRMIFPLGEISRCSRYYAGCLNRFRDG